MFPSNPFNSLLNLFKENKKESYALKYSDQEFYILPKKIVKIADLIYPWALERHKEKYRYFNHQTLKAFINTSLAKARYSFN